jgi:protein-L-isoaspartate(D-aspartate) O-methyltransferase
MTEEDRGASFVLSILRILAFFPTLPHKRARLEAAMDFVQARNRMVDGQVRTGDVTDLRILAAMLELPRERFAYPDHAELAYADFDLPMHGEPYGGEAVSMAVRCLLRPRTIAKLIQAADVGPADRVLDVGCATGYGAAVLSRLAAEVVGLEEDPELAAAAGKALAACRIRNVSVVTGPLPAGWPARQPYDVIVLEGAAEVAPRGLFEQLRDGGRLVCIEGRDLAGRAMVYRSAAGVVSGRSVFDAAAPLLPGFRRPAAFVF